MTTILSALPVLSTILALILGARSLHAAFLGVGSALLAILMAFPIPAADVAPAALRWIPILVEVLLIVGGGLLLSEVLREAGGQAALAKWIRGRAGQGVGAVLLVAPELIWLPLLVAAVFLGTRESRQTSMVAEA